MENIEILNKLANAKQQILNELKKVIIGQEKVIEETLCALFAGGHCLIQGVPGLAKTLLISSLAKVLNLKFSRIQFTPDLMPSDITGTDILTENKATNTKEFEFIKGPIFANIILADEINRTPPKTQSALLQAMQEYQVTAGNQTFNLQKPFLVMATQNPIEQEGTYPLPEAQLDRFMFNILIDYPSFEEELQIVDTTTKSAPKQLSAVLTAEQIIEMQNAILSIPVSESVLKYAVNLVRKTRPNSNECPTELKKLIAWGAGPRASQYLVLGAKTKAALNNRLTPSIQDVKDVAQIVLQHRISLTFAADAEGLQKADIIKQLL